MGVFSSLIWWPSRSNWKERRSSTRPNADVFSEAMSSPRCRILPLFRLTSRDLQTLSMDRNLVPRHSAKNSGNLSGSGPSRRSQRNEIGFLRHHLNVEIRVLQPILNEEGIVMSGTKNRSFTLCTLLVMLGLASALANADVVLDWNKIAVNTAVANKQNPFAQARYAAIVQLAVFEAVNSITQEYHPYLGTITAPPGASPEAAAIQAAYRVLSTYFPSGALDTEYANSLAQIPDSQAKTDGIATGEAAAQAMIALRASDGASPPKFKTPGPPVP